VNLHEERLEILRKHFAAPGQLRFDMAAPGIVTAVMESDHASATIALSGATVISYVPQGFGETLFLSKTGIIEPGKAIRGGIPLCWPWFGMHPENSTLPPHGFFRVLEWGVLDASLDPSAPSITLSLHDSEKSKTWWPHGFSALCRITLKDQLEIGISITNESAVAWDLSGAFHPYFRVSDLRNSLIHSFPCETSKDLMSTDTAEMKRAWSGDIGFAGETNRVYSRTGPIRLEDPGESRIVTVCGYSLESVGIWTPWRMKCAVAPDLDENDYTKFLCIEPGMIPPRIRRLKPGEILEAGISIVVGQSNGNGLTQGNLGGTH
jgi:glucose-6-phosphate 1-epimerase